MSPDVLEPVNELLMSGYVGQGDKVDQFEKLIGNYIGNPYINTVNSATSGLHLALRTANCVGDEVLTSPLTCFATNAPILANGYKVKWVDVDPNTCNVDLDDLERKLSPTTKVIMVVHWGGYPIDLDRLKSIQDKCHALYGFTPAIIEDCAHAWGSTYKEQRLGNHGNTCVYSFQAIKHVTAVDGGCIVHRSEAERDRVKDMRWYGLDRTKSANYRCEQDINEWGYKFHMNDLNATIGTYNLISASPLVESNKANASYYDSALQNVHGVQTMERQEDRESASWIYTIRVKNRDNFVKMMTEKGVAVSRVHHRNDEYSCMKDFRCALPNLDKLCEDMICIPCGWWVTTENREYIAESIKSGW